MYLKKWLAIGVSTAAIATVATAQLGIFGGGLPVFDGAALVEMIVQSAHLREQIQKAIQTYNKLADQYNHMQYQAQIIRDMGRYRSISTIWKQFQASDVYNRNAPWVQAVNTGVNATAAWENITRRSIPYHQIPAAVEDIYKNDFATIELQDGSAVNTIDLVGRIRQAGPQRESVLAQLENDAFTSALDMQTEAAQLNKANALLVFQSKQLMDQNRLLTNVAEMQLLRLKQERDAQVYTVNEAAYSQSRVAHYMTDTQGGPSQALRNFSVSLR